MALDLATEKGVLNFCERKRTEVRRQWEKAGRFEENGYSFVGYVFATCAPTGKELGPECWLPGKPLAEVEPKLCRLPKIAQVFSRNGRSTDVFSHVLTHYARACKAIGTLVIGEGWALVLPAIPGLSVEEQRRRYPKDLTDYDGPERHENLFMMLEHKAAGRRSWQAEILRHPSRLEPWQERIASIVPGADPESFDTEGMLTGFVETRS